MRKLMARVAALAFLASTLAVLELPGAAPARTRAETRPNIVVIMTDDQTVDDLRVMTTVRQELAAQGTTFDNSFVSFSLCCPSRATFLTGQYSHNHGVVGNDLANGLVRLDQSNTLAVWLRRAGYNTSFVGKYLNEYGKLMGTKIPPGWTDWYAGVRLAYFNHTMSRQGKLVRYGYDAASYQTDVYTNTAVDLIHRRAKGTRPFFLWLTYFAPHVGGPREPGDAAGLKTAVTAPRHRNQFLTTPLPTSQSFNEEDVSDKPSVIRGLPLLGPTEIDAITQSYRRRLRSLLAVDEGVANVLAALRAEGVLKNTFIMFTSDNGFLMGEHRIIDDKQFLYEPSIRVPLIVRGPGVPKGIHLEQPVANVDLAPTIVDVSGARAGRTQDGRSFRPLFSDGTQEWGRDLLLERGPGVSITGPRIFTAIRTPRFVYAEYATGEHELYDLGSDPDEMRNVQGNPAYAAVEAELGRRLSLLRDCAGTSCRAGPALQLTTSGDASCVRAARVSGLDEPTVSYVDFIVAGRGVARDMSRPFEQALTAPAGAPGPSLIRALVMLTDGRRLTLDQTAQICS